MENKKREERLYHLQDYTSKPEFDEEFTFDDWKRMERLIMAQELNDQGDEVLT